MLQSSAENVIAASHQGCGTLVLLRADYVATRHRIEQREKQKSGEEAKQDVMDKRSEARRTFADKARAAAREEDNSNYHRGIQAAIKSYDDELKKRVYAKRDELRDPAGYEKEVDKQFKEGTIKEVQHKSMLEGYKMVREAYDVLMAANWNPVLTAKGQGETRLDIYEMRRTRDDEGNPEPHSRRIC